MIRHSSTIGYRAALLCASLSLTGCALLAPARAQAPAAAPPAAAPAAAEEKPVPPATADDPTAVIETARGIIRIHLYPSDAPKTVANFVKLAKSGFYDGLTFHRVVPGFVIQGGDPNGDGTGGPGYTIPDEKNKLLKHTVGALAMAKTSEPNSAGSQFYIVITNPQPRLDELGYTVFGQVIAGQDVAEQIQVGDKMTHVRILENHPAKVVKRVDPDVPADVSDKPVDVVLTGRFLVKADGSFTVELVHSSGNPKLDDLVLQAMRAWTWAPAIKDGAPVDSTQTQDVHVTTATHGTGA